MKSFIVLPFRVRMGVTSSAKEFVNWWNKYCAAKDKLDQSYIERCAGMAGVLDDRPQSPLFVMYLAPEYSESILFHESLHMAHFIMDYSESPINLDSTEVQAHLMEHIAAKVTEKLK